MKYLFVLVFIIVYIFFDIDLGYSHTSPLYTHFTYMFQHASLMHLLMNSISYIVLFTLLERLIKKSVIVPVSFAIGFAASFLAVYDIPTVGISSVIYAMIGIYIGMVLFSPKVKIADTRRFLLFIGCIAASLLISLFKENSNFWLHLASLIISILVSLTIDIIINQKISYDTK